MRRIVPPPRRPYPVILQGVIDWWECLNADEMIDICEIVRAARNREALKQSRERMRVIRCDGQDKR